ncbi:hypothetical protein PAMP_022121 [Pampus punctatissimus]
MAGKIQQLSESAVIRSLRRFRDRYFSTSSKVDNDVVDITEEESQPGFLDNLSVDVQFLIMTFLSPADICCLGATSQYWRAMVRDPLLWRFFLLRDMPNWPSIDHLTMPQLELLDAPLVSENEILDNTEEEGDQGKESKLDYMAEWIPERMSIMQTKMASFMAVIQGCNLTPSVFGTLIRATLCHAWPWHGKSGCLFSHKAYACPRCASCLRHSTQTNKWAERERARVQQQNITNKLFTLEGSDDSGYPVYSLAPQVQQVCQVVDGFIYVANAEPGRDERESEAAQIQAVLSSIWGSTSRPLLVLSCVSREETKASRTTGLQTSTNRNKTRYRTPCVDMAKRLGLPQLANPWMVQDTVAESLSGLLDGISWLLRCSGVKLYSS